MAKQNKIFAGIEDDYSLQEYGRTTFTEPKTRIVCLLVKDTYLSGSLLISMPEKQYRIVFMGTAGTILKLETDIGFYHPMKLQSDPEFMHLRSTLLNNISVKTLIRISMRLIEEYKEFQQYMEEVAV